MKIGRVLESYSSQRNFTLRCEHGEAEVTFIGKGCVKLRVATSLKEDGSWAVVREDIGEVKVAVDEDGDGLVAGDGKVVVYVDKRSCTFSFTFNNAEFCCDASPIELWDGGFTIRKKIADGEHYFGFGEKAKTFDKRGCRLVMKNTDPQCYNRNTDPLYKSIPFFIALRKGFSYGFFLDNTYETVFDMGFSDPTVYTVTANGGEAKYYVIPGPSPSEVIEKYTLLTGRTPLPPLWALGYQQSRWGYKSADQVLRIIDEFRRRDIPCDVVYLDIDYMDGYRAFTWHPKRFPDPKGFTREAMKKGVKVVAIAEVGVKRDRNYDVYREGVEKGYFVRRRNGKLFTGVVWAGGEVFPDLTREEVREWWASLYIKLLREGVSGIWNDMNEPVYDNLVMVRRPRIKIDDVVFYDGKRFLPFEEVRNVYALLEAVATVRAFNTVHPDKRTFILTRSGYAGIQRYAATWTGDNMSTWDHILLSVEMLLNLSVSGVPFAGADIGGFGKLAFKRPFIARCTPEMYARWIQLGVFYPLCRSHTFKGWKQEPWVFGENVEKIARTYIKLRYALLPYIYSLFWEHLQTGMPIMRPLFLHYPNDERCYRGDEFLFGPFILVAPVYVKGARLRKVYLPKGVWYNYWTGEKHIGPWEGDVEAPLERIPLFVAEGAILPKWPPMSYVGEKKVDELTLEVYPGNGEFNLYEDDGESVDSEYAVTKMACGVFGDRVRLEIGERKGKYNPKRESYKVMFRCIDDVKEVIMDGREVGFLAGKGEVTVSLVDDGKKHVVELVR
ncbi:MAG: TIM-barrel domain-containing protein [Candidatus Freyarchaeota archaeon]